MKEIFYQYLILTRQLSLPGIGTIRIEKLSSEFDFAEKIFTAPVFMCTLDPNQEKPLKKLYSWLSAVQNIPEGNAVQMVNDFSFDLKNQISSEGHADFLPAGRLRRDETGTIVLDALPIVPESEKPVKAEKISRESAVHSLRVGEMDKTSDEMEVLLAEHPHRKITGWLSIIIAIIAMLFLGWYFSQKGCTPAATGNQTVIRVQQ
jgi:hypothetical protein